MKKASNILLIITIILDVILCVLHIVQNNCFLFILWLICLILGIVLIIITNKTNK